MKSIIALATSTIIATLAFVLPADAQTRRTGNTFSQMGEDETNVIAEFDLVDVDKDGNTINDSDNSDNIGFFSKAIENYKAGFIARACLSFDVAPVCQSGTANGRYVFDESGFLIRLQENDTSGIIPVDGNLKAELIENDPLFPGNPDTIAYSIFIDGQTDPVQRYRLDFSAFGFNQDDAINNLSYILEQNVLSKVRVFSSFNSSTLGIADVLLQNSFEEDLATTPESSTNMGILVLGFLQLLYLIGMKNNKRLVIK